jgi:hypothetical protein
VKAVSGQLGSLMGFLASNSGERMGARRSWVAGPSRRRRGAVWCSMGFSRTCWREALLDEGRAVIWFVMEELRRCLVGGVRVSDSFFGVKGRNRRSYHALSLRSCSCSSERGANEGGLCSGLFMI